MKSLTAVGLEVREDRTRAVELTEGTGGLTIRCAAEVATPPGSVTDGRVIEPALLAVALRELWALGEFSARRCVVVLSSSQVTQQRITVPPAPFAEQRMIVRSELERFAAVDEESYFGWLPMTASDEVAENALAFLVQDGVFDGYDEALALAGLEADAYEPAALAALRVPLRETGGRSGEPDGSAATAFLYAAEHGAELAVFAEAGLSYCRGLETEGEESDREAAPRSLVAEIERSLHYYRRAYRESPQPSRLHLFGDHPATAAFLPQLRDMLGMEVVHLHPLAALGEHGLFVGDGDAFLAAAGGALRLLGKGRLDLRMARESPDSDPSQSQFVARFGRVALIAAGTALTVALLSTSLLTLRLKQASEAHEAAAAALKGAKETREALALRRQAMRADLKRLAGTALPAADLMRYLRGIVPRGAGLRSLELKEDGALALRGEARSIDHVTTLVRRLTYDLHFHAPEVESIQRTPEKRGITFAVRTGLVGYGLRASREP